MKPRVTVTTLGVDDLDRADHFYRDGLGLPSRDTGLPGSATGLTLGHNLSSK